MRRIAVIIGADIGQRSVERQAAAENAPARAPAVAIAGEGEVARDQPVILEIECIALVDRGGIARPQGRGEDIGAGIAVDQPRKDAAVIVEGIVAGAQIGAGHRSGRAQRQRVAPAPAEQVAVQHAADGKAVDPAAATGVDRSDHRRSALQVDREIARSGQQHGAASAENAPARRVDDRRRAAGENADAAGAPAQDRAGVFDHAAERQVDPVAAVERALDQARRRVDDAQAGRARIDGGGHGRRRRADDQDRAVVDDGQVGPVGVDRRIAADQRPAVDDPAADPAIEEGVVQSAGNRSPGDLGIERSARIDAPGPAENIARTEQCAAGVETNAARVGAVDRPGIGHAAARQHPDAVVRTAQRTSRGDGDRCRAVGGDLGHRAAARSGKDNRRIVADDEAATLRVGAGKGQRRARVEAADGDDAAARDVLADRARDVLDIGQRGIVDDVRTADARRRAL